MLKTRRRFTTPSLLVLAGDLACLVLFALIGLRSHEDGITLSGLVRSAVPFQAGWIAANAVLGQPTETPRGFGSLVQSVMRPWVPAWVVGLVLRKLVFGRDFAPTFAIVSFITNSVLLVAWRVLAAHIVRPSKPGED